MRYPVSDGEHASIGKFYIESDATDDMLREEQMRFERECSEYITPQHVLHTVPVAPHTPLFQEKWPNPVDSRQCEDRPRVPQ